MDQEDEECTFSPQISSYAKTMSPMGSLSERAHHILEEKQSKIQALASQLQDEMDRELTFKPQINKTHSPQREGDFLSHIEQEFQKRREKLEELRKKRLELENATFSPEISTYSKSLQREEPIHERLYKIAATPKPDLAHAPSEDVDPETGQPLFQPQVNPTGLMAVPARDERVEDALYKDAENRRLRKIMLLESVRMEEESTRSARKITDKSLEFARRKREKELRAVFDSVDQENHGHIEFSQLDTAMSHLGLFKDAEKRTEEEVKILDSLWEALDPNHAGAVDFPTFFRVLTAILDPSLGMHIQDESALPDTASETLSVASPTRTLTKDLRKLFINKLAYANKAAASSKDRPVSPELSPECTFRPQIDPISRQIETYSRMHSSGDSDGSKSPTPRYMKLYEKARDIDERLKAEREARKDDDIKGLTFQPKINKTKAEIPSRKSFGGPAYEALYALRNRPKSSDGQLTTDERRFLENCTFQPDRQKTKNKSVVTSKEPKLKPRGFEKAVSHLRHAKDEREQNVKNQFSNQLRSFDPSDPPTARPKSSAGPTEPKPFSLSQKRQTKKPLLYMDVNLGPGRSGRIGIHEGDDPRVLARNFAVSYQLDETLAARLEDLLRQHIEQLTGATEDV